MVYAKDYWRNNMTSHLEKTQRVNLLMDCYGDLLTDKQRQYLSLYYEEDFSLSHCLSNSYLPFETS